MLLKRWVGKYGKVKHVIIEPDGDDSVIVDLDPVRCHVSDLEVIPAIPTDDELKAEYDRRVAIIENFTSNPSDPERFQELLNVLRDIGLLPKRP